MSNGSTQQSLGDFAALLVREVAQALLLARENAPFVEVRSIFLRLGKIPEGVGDEVVGVEPSLILEDRYPLLDKGWELELELDNQVQAKLNGEPFVSQESLRTALDLFGSQPVAWLKGISDQWSLWFADVGVITVEQLASLKDDALLHLIKKHHSALPREFRGKASLLRVPLPALPSNVSLDGSLYEALSLSEKALHQIVGTSKVSTTEIQRIAAILDAFAITIDSEFLHQLPFSCLLDGKINLVG